MLSTKSKYLLIAISLLAFLGFLDATYLTILHFQNTIPQCSLINGCETVLTSSFAVVFGIPISLIGSLYFITLLFFSLAILFKLNRVPKTFVAFTALGGLVAVILIFIQAFVLGSFCLYCMVSDIISLLILTFVFVILKLKND